MVEYIWEGVLGDGLEGNFWEEGLPLCVQSKFECLHGCSGHNILWQLVPVWDYSEADKDCIFTIYDTGACGGIAFLGSIFVVTLCLMTFQERVGWRCFDS